MSKLVELFKGGAWLTLADLAAKIAAAFSLPILARLLSPELLGVYSIVISLVLTAKDFSSLGIELAIHRNGAQYKTIGSEAVSRLFSVGFLLICIFTAVVALLIWMMRDPLARFWLGNSSVSPFLSYAAIIIALQPLSEIPLKFLAALHQFRVHAVQSSVAAILTNSIPLIFAWQLGLLGAISGVILSFVLRIAFSYSVVRPVLRANRICWRLDKFWQEAKALLQFGLPYYIGNTLLASIVGLPLLGLVSQYGGLEEMGYIRVAISMAVLVGFIPSAIGPVVISQLSSISNDVAESQKMKLLHFRVIWSIVLILNGSICLLLPKLIVVLYGYDYEPSISLAWVHLWLTGIVCISNSLAQYLLADGKTGRLFKANSIGIISTAIIAYLLVPHHTALGYLVAQIIGQILILLDTLHVAVLSKVSRSDLVLIRNFGLLTVIVFSWTLGMLYVDMNQVIRTTAAVMSAALVIIILFLKGLHPSEKMALRKKIMKISPS